MAPPRSRPKQFYDRLPQEIQTGFRHFLDTETADAPGDLFEKIYWQRIATRLATEQADNYYNALAQVQIHTRFPSTSESWFEDSASPEPTIGDIGGGRKLLVPGTVGVLYGPPNAGKSWVGVALVAAILAGPEDESVHWLGFEPHYMGTRLPQALGRPVTALRWESREDDLRKAKYRYYSDNFDSIFEPEEFGLKELPASVTDLSEENLGVILKYADEVIDDVRFESYANGMQLYDDFRDGVPRAGGLLTVVDAWHGIETALTGTAGDTTGAGAEAVVDHFRSRMDGTGAVLLLDHTDKTGKGWIGSQRKRAAVDAAYKLESVVPFSKSKAGYSVITCDKSDRASGTWAVGETVAYLVVRPGERPVLTVEPPDDIVVNRKVSVASPSPSGPQAGNSSTSNKMDAGRAAMDAVLADGRWHEYAELAPAVVATGLAERTAQNILTAARKDNDRYVMENRPVPGAKYRYWYKLADAGE